MSLPTTARQYRIPNFGNIDTALVLTEGEVPTPTANDVLVKIHAASLNYRDLLVVQGRLPGTKENLIPGSDSAGEVVAVGDRVAKWKIGDRVIPNFNTAFLHGDLTEELRAFGLGGNIDGVLTEYQIFPAEALLRVPEHLTYEQAASLPCAAITAWNALQGPVPLKGGDYLLVQGTGGVSTFGIQIAHALGAIVIATSSSDAKLEIAKKLGASYGINYKTTPDWEQEVLKITGGRGVDHVIEVGGPATLLKSIAAVRYAGHIHNIGFVGGFQTDLTALQVTSALLIKGITFRSVLIGTVAQFEDLNRLITALKIVPVVDKSFEFTEATEAYKYLASQQHVGKVVIRVAST